MHSKTMALLSIQKQPGVGLNKHDLQSLQYPVLPYQSVKGQNDFEVLLLERKILRDEFLGWEFALLAHHFWIDHLSNVFVGLSSPYKGIYTTSRLREGYAEASRNAG